MKYYARDVVYGANDGIVTTFAIIAGAVGADLPFRVITIIGGASLVPDGFSMAASDFLAARTHRAIAIQDDGVDENHKAVSTSPWRSALWTFVGFVMAGLLPLLPYTVPALHHTGFLLAATFTGVALFASVPHAP